MDSPVTQGKRVARRLEAYARHINRHTAFRFVLLVLGETGGDGAEQWNIHDPAAELLQRRGDAQGASLAGVGFDEALALERCQMDSGPTVAGKTKPRRNFPQSGDRPAGSKLSLDEIQHALLGFGQFGHIVSRWILHRRTTFNLAFELTDNRRQAGRR
jgi:hypothetical protein